MLLQCSETKKVGEKNFACSKWLNMNERAAHKNIKLYKRYAEIKNFGKYLLIIRCKWENGVSKTLPLLEAAGNEIRN
jgi:hypothetical protein